MSSMRPVLRLVPAALLAIAAALALGCSSSRGDDDLFGLCDEAEDCEPSDYCEVTDCGGPGQCERRPTHCPIIDDPVCGCDGLTYASECHAKREGVDIESQTPCP